MKKFTKEDRDDIIFLAEQVGELIPKIECDILYLTVHTLAGQLKQGNNDPADLLNIVTKGIDSYHKLYDSRMKLEDFDKRSL